MRRPTLPYLLSADGGGGAGGPAAPSAQTSTTTGDAGAAASAAAQPAPAGVSFASQAEFDAAVNARVEAATASTRAQVEAWQKAALDAHFDGLYQEHGIPEALRSVVRAQWEALKPGEDGHRPDPRTHLPEQDWFKALKPAPAAQPTRTRTGKSEPPPSAPSPAAVATPAPATPAQPTGLPPYVIRGPGSAAAPAATKPAATYAEAAQVFAQQLRASP